MPIDRTREQFAAAAARCRSLFVKKLHDYGCSWRVMRPESLTDQINIKISRIRQIQLCGKQRVEDGVFEEFVGIVNYGIIALIQREKGVADKPEMSNDDALAAYDAKLKETTELMLDKNHDYGEAWRRMRISSFADLILTKVYRTKQIEDLAGATLVSEGIDANYMDMINYSLFALIILGE